MIRKWFIRALALLLVTTGSPAAERIAEHVVVIGLDGCRPEAIQQAAGPVLKSLWTNGAWSWQAQASLPSVTHVNFASILTGSVPEKHGIKDKDWVTGSLPKVKVPTIFEVVSKSKLSAAGFFGHEKLYPSETPLPNVYFEHSKYEAQTVGPVAAKYLREHKPAFCFIYMGNLDGAGHKYGWLSLEQLAQMPSIDQGLKAIVDALRDSGMWEKTLLIITADHGGHGKAHSTGTPEDCTVPWIAAGPLVKPGAITTAVRNLDTAAMAAYALGLEQPTEWDGHAVKAVLR